VNLTEVLKLLKKNKKFVAVLAVILTAAVVVASAYTGAPLLKLGGTVKKTPLKVAEIVVNFGNVSSGDVEAKIGMGSMTYEGKLGLIYNFTVDNVPDGIIASWVPILITDSNNNKIYWLGGILLINGKYAKIFTDKEYLTRLIYIIYGIARKVHVLPPIIDTLNECLVINVSGRNVTLCPHPCKVVNDPLDICIVYAPVYPFYLPGNVTYVVRVAPHILTEYVANDTSFAFTITVLGYPVVTTNYVANITKYMMPPIPRSG